ncbi:hypothetical protein ACFYPG_23820 [Micromonospora sp. NPDC005553]|uniref:hypothetical protein n=1 Tax=Micromonospora sp. NPDC005553 TaxID=3364232 RepID=UPI0036A04313
MNRAARYGDGWHAIAVSPYPLGGVVGPHSQARTELTRLAPERHLGISLRISTTVDSASRQDDPEATTLLGDPGAVADRIHQHQTAGVEEFVLDRPAPTGSGYLLRLHRSADDFLPLLTSA